MLHSRNRNASNLLKPTYQVDTKPLDSTTILAPNVNHPQDTSEDMNSSLATADRTDCTLPPSEWQVEMARHRTEMETWTEPFRKRRKQGGSHPIHDFLFVYYRLQPSKLKQWHPGIDRKLLIASATPLPAWFQQTRYSRVPNQSASTRSNHPEILFCDPTKISAAEKIRLAFILDLLSSTQLRKPNFFLLWNARMGDGLPRS